MASPLLSVIIPTARRPEYLPRAISSALLAAPDDDVEVIVVPNGLDDSWKSVVDQFRDDHRVKWCPIKVPHANAARNHGLVLAAGAYVRFLDDDDYLYPEIAVQQVNLLESKQGDVCSGAVNVVDESDGLIRVLRQPVSDDLVVATLAPSRLTLPTAHVFRRSLIVDLRWDEGRAVRQDTDWMIRVALLKGIKWICIAESTGVWVQHLGLRVSKGRDPGDRVLKETAEMISAAFSRLECDGTLSEARRIAAADALWSCLQKGLRYDLRYWRGVARLADSYAPGRTPPARLYRLGLVRSLSPLLVETVLVPIRWIYHPVRRVLEALGIQRG